LFSSRYQSNYKTTLTPYDTARTLHRVGDEKAHLSVTPLHLDAVGVCKMVWLIVVDSLLF